MKNLIREVNIEAGMPMISRGPSANTPNKLARWSANTIKVTIEIVEMLVTFFFVEARILRQGMPHGLFFVRMRHKNGIPRLRL